MNRVFPYIVLLSLLLTGCEIDQKDFLPEDGFTKIYNHPEETLSFYTESLVELSQGGFILISALKDENSELEYPSTHIIRTSAAGELLWAQSYDWLAPSSNLIQLGNTIGFVAMNNQFEAHAVIIDEETGDVRDLHDLQMTMPLYSHTDSQGKLIVLGYDFVSRSSWVSSFGANFVLEASVKLDISTDLEYEIQRHLNKTGQEYPFFIGEYNTSSTSGYFVNCFYNYTLRSVFLDGSSLTRRGDIYSFRTEEGISSMFHKEDDIFGITSYYEGNNYILPAASIDVNSSQNIKDLPAVPLYELTFKAGVEVEKISADSLEYELFISQTNSNSLVFYQYAMDSDSLVNTLYKEMDQKVEVSDFIQTANKGIVVLANTHI